MSLYDYIYVDRDKIISLYSQMTGGIIEALERSAENSRTSDNKRNYDFKIFKHDAGGTANDKSTSKEVIKPHHALLKETEELLAKNGYLLDLTEPSTSSNSLRDISFRTQLQNTFCIKVRGRAVIEDYERIKHISSVFPDVVKLINKSIESSIENTPAYTELKSKLIDAEKEARTIKDRNIRSAKEQRIKELKEALAEHVSNANKVKVVDQWILDGAKTWIDAFLPSIVNLRIYPRQERPDEHIFGHLKKSCFEDGENFSFHFTYGSFPTEDLTMIGIVTSVPVQEGEQFKPLVEFEKNELSDNESVERGFRGLFRGFDGLEQMVRTCRFPRVLVYPLTVYRSVAPNLHSINQTASQDNTA